MIYNLPISDFIIEKSNFINNVISLKDVCAAFDSHQKLMMVNTLPGKVIKELIKNNLHVYLEYIILNQRITFLIDFVESENSIPLDKVIGCSKDMVLQKIINSKRLPKLKKILKSV